MGNCGKTAQFGVIQTINRRFCGGARRQPYAHLQGHRGKPDAKESDFKFMKEKLKIIPLGGLNEIGKNMTVIEYG